MADAAATEGNDAVTELDDDACWSLLETQALGRIAISAERLEIFPVNYLVHDRSIYFSSAPGSKLMDLAENPSVAFEGSAFRETEASEEVSRLALISSLGSLWADHGEVRRRLLSSGVRRRGHRHPLALPSC